MQTMTLTPSSETSLPLTVKLTVPPRGCHAVFASGTIETLGFSTAFGWIGSAQLGIPGSLRLSLRLAEALRQRNSITTGQLAAKMIGRWLAALNSPVSRAQDALLPWWSAVTLVPAVTATGDHRQDFPEYLAEAPDLGHFAA